MTMKYSENPDKQYHIPSGRPEALRQDRRLL